MIVAISWKEVLECRSEIEVTDEAEAQKIVDRLEMGGQVKGELANNYEELSFQVEDADWETVQS